MSYPQNMYKQRGDMNRKVPLTAAYIWGQEEMPYNFQNDKHAHSSVHISEKGIWGLPPDSCMSRCFCKLEVEASNLSYFCPSSSGVPEARNPTNGIYYFPSFTILMCIYLCILRITRPPFTHMALTTACI